MDSKVYENRLRRMARRQGLILKKSRRRDPLATDYGKFQLVDEDNRVVHTGLDWLDIEQVEDWLTGKRRTA